MPRTGWGGGGVWGCHPLHLCRDGSSSSGWHLHKAPGSFTAQTLTLTWRHENGKCTDLWRRKQVAIITCDDCNQQDILALSSSRVNVLWCGCFHHKINVLLGLCVKRLTTMQSKIKIHLVIKRSIKWRPEDFICRKTKFWTILKQNNSRAGFWNMFILLHFQMKKWLLSGTWVSTFVWSWSHKGAFTFHSRLTTRTLKNPWNRCSQSLNGPCLCDSPCHFLKASQRQDAACSVTGSSPLSQMS